MQTVVLTSKTISVLLAAALMAACSMPNIPPAAAVAKPTSAALEDTNTAVAPAAPQATTAPAAQSEEELLLALFERVAPSVVYIKVTQRSGANTSDQQKLPGLIPPDDTPDGFPDRSQGSGFIFDD